jgi:predicted enzyme related to lactoylglutathione lyase
MKVADRAAEVAVWNHRADVNTPREGSTPMQMKLELIPLPVSDVDQAIDFYADKLGFNKDVDVQPAEGVRVVQMTPEGSGCSVGFGTGLEVYAGEPGSARGLHLVVEDITEARAELLGRGVEVSDIHDFGGGVKGAGFSDPDGNSFELQEMAWRKGAKY